MPSVLIAAADLGVTGAESPEALQDDVELNRRLAAIRLQAAELMGMGDVSSTTVPKMVLLSAPTDGGVDLAPASFLPVKVHTSIGVLGALTVAAGVSHRRRRRQRPRSPPVARRAVPDRASRPAISTS